MAPPYQEAAICMLLEHAAAMVYSAGAFVRLAVSG
jgi:hypothetical protein